MLKGLAWSQGGAGSLRLKSKRGKRGGTVKNPSRPLDSRQRPPVLLLSRSQPWVHHKPFSLGMYASTARKCTSEKQLPLSRSCHGSVYPLLSSSRSCAGPLWRRHDCSLVFKLGLETWLATHPNMDACRPLPMLSRGQELYIVMIIYLTIFPMVSILCMASQRHSILLWDILLPTTGQVDGHRYELSMAIQCLRDHVLLLLGPTSMLTHLAIRHRL